MPMANRSVNAVDIRLIVVLLLEREADRLIQQRQVRLDAGWGVNQRSRRALLRQRLRRHLRVCFSWEVRLLSLGTQLVKVVLMALQTRLTAVVCRRPDRTRIKESHVQWEARTVVMLQAMRLPMVTLRWMTRVLALETPLICWDVSRRMQAS
ncbi:hypothetical protein PF007_g25095 [Phytophthora fragariae]|uniref:Uncharacterized protein n=1 Tax=Phytophthora fragariae TaxID=53985 RepID=A0A6A3EGN9_9STRA|nr:hypothetical protein PF003_g36012 [Phytophthora fragariae]KAE8930350.1 hypothetical protein PF009_g19558 [Phytophthora fragariae]KAE9075203.1 hypothetical protein PF007_g25095 [Phytophthora fragariae]